MTGTALTFPTPASLGSLDHYIQAVNRFPLLTAEQETALGRRLVRDDDLSAARELVLSHLRLVVAVSRNYLGYGLPQADLIQEGNVGLMKAVRRFDPERGVRLVSFALHWIKAEIHEYILRNWRLVKVATTKAQRKLFFNLRGMKATTAALTPTEARAIARDLGVKPEEVVEMETRLSGRDVVLDPQPDDNGDSMGPIAWLTDTEDEPMQILERRQTASNRSKGLSTALARLDERSRRIIEARWLREDDPATLQDLATEYGVSAERIRQLEVKAMKTMRSQMGALA
ncbi:MAG: RNA polymerase sigma factor RpoH [Betaproteobacteria bacterium]|jgi:RNA polymerase sigma-32 factor|nr:RNA polymerase sigma factor RpoH [Betaproteobacteria bacterium]MBK6600152.1 RNA polymerase sigma factor RpoH [Betaproteobacteria bacterium]MBK7080641.1 RNA polymerase sigma factor RpoH [Betaproteobacteria bacterium]MBK7590836.1 RNA polymerase sigma factor RpoH [Betaproteobacteria bacterium]MBK7742336.1 RNA polymerase sigma factor RpoH [Betaproteobacteria bacterium]